MDKPPKLTIDRLDKLAEVLDKEPVGKVELVFGLIKIILALAYLWSRRRLIDENILWNKQQVEKNKEAETRKELNEESFHDI